MTADNEPWWEDKDDGEPAIDWQGRPYDPANGPAAHPNSRFTVSAQQNPCYSPMADAPDGVPISAIVFGGRRRELAPLVYEARDWAHGVLVGAGVASETTAAATGKVGVVRRDPMAMKPFCGYNFGDYWEHWLSFAGKVGQAAEDLPRQLVPSATREAPSCGRASARTCACCDGSSTAARARPRPSRHRSATCRTAGELNTKGLDVDPTTLKELLTVVPEAWREEMADVEEYLDAFGQRTPRDLKAELTAVRQQLGYKVLPGTLRGCRHHVAGAWHLVLGTSYFVAEILAAYEPTPAPAAARARSGRCLSVPPSRGGRRNPRPSSS